MSFCAVNGVVTEQISCQDRGFAFGDGVFTTAKVLDGKIPYLSQHLNRLSDGCLRLGIAPPDLHRLADSVIEQAQSYPKAVLKMVVTAGVGGRGYARSCEQGATVVVSFSAFPEHYAGWQQNGIALGISTQRIGVNPMLAGLKHLNRLEQVLIRQELIQRQAQEAIDELLVLNVNEQVVETSCANVFWLQDDTWFTPDLTHSGVDGLMRQRIMQTVPDVEVLAPTLAQVMTAQAMFICNSLMDIVPVTNIAERKLALSPVLHFKERLL